MQRDEAAIPAGRRSGTPRPGWGSTHGTTLEGILERVTYANEETAWSVVKLAVPGRRDLVTVVGNLLGVQPGENVPCAAAGPWTGNEEEDEEDEGKKKENEEEDEQQEPWRLT